jgi:hypothetical protein
MFYMTGGEYVNKQPSKVFNQRMERTNEKREQ